MIRLNSLFTDGAVLQRFMPITVWGVTEPNNILDCELASVTATSGSGYDGRFFFRLPPFPAGGPYTLTVSNRQTGEKVSVSDVLIGEVWLASGQSNMEFRMDTSRLQKKEFAETNHAVRTIRMFNVEKRAKTTLESEAVGKWNDASRENIGDFSAVGAWFAKKLHDRLNVPIGILHSSWGGTIVEAWTSRNTLLSNPDYSGIQSVYESQMNDPSCWKNCDMTQNADQAHYAYLLRTCVPDTENRGFAEGWHQPGFNDSIWDNFSIPGCWTQKKKVGNGVIWIRKNITIPDSWNGKNLILHLGNIDKQDITYFNGVPVGKTGEGFEESYWNVNRDYSIPGNLVKGGNNLLAIRAFSFLYDGAFGGTSDLYCLELPETGEKINIAGECLFHVEKDNGTAQPPTSVMPSFMGVDNQNSPSILFDGMIRPLIPYTIRGVIWYQGESNAHSVEEALQYRRKIVDMIRDWRFWWGQGNFPFIQVELAAFRPAAKYSGEDAWPYLRNAQRLAALDVGNCGLASALDAGDAGNIHPLDKKTVGIRLADWALKNTYRTGLEGEGPAPKEIRMEGPGIRVCYHHCRGGLVTKDGTSPRGFYLAGLDRVFSEASAEIQGDSIVLTSAQVKQPRHVRYAWADNPEGINLYNGDGFPAATFEY